MNSDFVVCMWTGERRGRGGGGKWTLARGFYKGV